MRLKKNFVIVLKQWFWDDSHLSLDFLFQIVMKQKVTKCKLLLQMLTNTWAYMCTCRYKGFRTKRRGQNANVLSFHQISNLGFGIFGEWLIMSLAYQNGRIYIAYFHIFPSLSCYSSRILGLSIAENVHLLTFQAIGSKNNWTISCLVGIMEFTFA